MVITAPSPLHRLSEQDLEKLAKEFDAIHDEVFAELDERDRHYIKTVISVQRQIIVAGRVLLLASRSRTAWVLGTACLSMAKILENMELGHNILHGQWDWMNDPDVHSSVWDWDTASSAKAWKHSHNYIHHTYTNILGKDKDLGYEIMRIDPHQKWRPGNLGQPLYNLLLMLLFEWGVAVHDTDIEGLIRGQKTFADLKDDFKEIGVKARQQIVKDYLGWPMISAGAFALAQLALRGRLPRPPHSRLGNRLRRITGNRRVGTGGRSARPAGGRCREHLPADPGGERTGQRHPERVGPRHHLLRTFPDQTWTFTEEEVENETRGGWYVRQLLGAANIEGSPLFHIISGNLGYQVEHHLFPDMPSSRYAEIAPKVKDICERYELPYNSGPFGHQWFTVQRTIFRLAFPGGTPRPKPGPYRSPDREHAPKGPSEAARFRGRVPAEHPDAGPEHASGGVAVQLPPRGND